MSATSARKPRPRRLLDGFPPDTRIVAVGVTWDDYENLVNQVGEARNFRIAFDGKNIEMMTLGPFHERQKSRLDLFTAFVAGELKVRSQPMGSTTWRRNKLKRAIESDLCYYFEPAKLAAAADSDNIDDFPNPDLAVEVDVSPPKIDRSGIYAALGVPEFWRARKKSVSIEQLGPDGKVVTESPLAVTDLFCDDAVVGHALFSLTRRQRSDRESACRATTSPTSACSSCA